MLTFLDISRQVLEIHLSQYDLKRLEYYARNMADYHLIVDLLPTVCKLYCLGSMGETHFSAVQLVPLVTFFLFATHGIKSFFYLKGNSDRYGVTVQNC